MHSALRCSMGCMTYRICVNIGEERGSLVEAGEDQLTDHQAKVEVERGETQLVVYFTLKCETMTEERRRGEIKQKQSCLVMQYAKSYFPPITR